MSDLLTSPAVCPKCHGTGRFIGTDLNGISTEYKCLICDAMKRDMSSALLPDAQVLKRPDCYEFAMDFLGDPEETIVRQYVELLELQLKALRIEVAAITRQRDDTYEQLQQVKATLQRVTYG